MPLKSHRHYVKARQRSRPKNKASFPTGRCCVYCTCTASKSIKQSHSNLLHVRVYAAQCLPAFHASSKTPNLNAGVSSPRHLPSSLSPSAERDLASFPSTFRVPFAFESSLQIDLFLSFLRWNGYVLLPSYLAH
jgi:hypothetical protein